MTNRVSFMNVSKWKRDFDMKCIAIDSQPTPCLLVANKSDSDILRREVNDDEIERLCVQMNFTAWTQMSVKENYMVEDSMTFLISTVLSQDDHSTLNGEHDPDKMKLSEQRTRKSSCSC